MLTIDRLCSHMIRLLHAPIHVYGLDGTLLTVYVDLGEQQDVFSCDLNLLTQLLERATAAYPVFIWTLMRQFTASLLPVRVSLSSDPAVWDQIRRQCPSSLSGGME